ncbi:MAG: PPC domain-containing protein [Planctomycetota bacterium]|nr:PPC domain-containing protein [Planctomycetota bacterium]
MTRSSTPVTPAPPDYAGNSMSAARNLGMLNGTQTYSDFVGQADAADWYHFRLATGSEFHLRMDGMTADADVRLLDSGGRVIGGSYNGGANPEFVDAIIEGGDYYLQVSPWGTANTNYQLAITTAPFARNLVASQDAWYRFNTGSGELGYRVGDTISVGQRLGYLEARDYNGSPEPTHAHVTISNAVNPPPNYWLGRGLSETDLLRARYIRPELAWSLLR